ncbi:MAG TPA: hypothetical protein VJY33_02560 [Isosphaeraceae bacterium]|nr:hypothetical protein [Isosphaeraceae bacterium]
MCQPLHLALARGNIPELELAVVIDGGERRRVGCDRAGAKDYAAFLGFFSLELP